MSTHSKSIRQVKEDEMVRACSKNGEKNACRILVGKKEDRWEDQDVSGRIMLK
jgi:hypothetical protein